MTGPNPIIREVTSTGVDLERVRLLFHSYAEEFADTVAESLCFQGFAAEVAGLPGRYAPPSGCLLLALADDEPLGCVAMRDLGDGTCEMKRLYVAPAGRRQRIGLLLVAELLRVAAEKGYDRMVLDTLPEMDRAIALYRSLGFTEIGPYWNNPVPRTVYFEKLLR